MRRAFNWRVAGWFAAAGLSFAVQAAPNDYDAALQALSRGDDKGAVERLRRLLEVNPVHAGAWLDLGILYCENGLTESARQIFSLIEERFAPSPAIGDLIARYRSTGCAPLDWTARSRWTLGASLGHDGNANQGTDQTAITLFLNGIPTSLNLAPESRAQGDNWQGLNLGWRAPLDGQWTAAASLSHRQYSAQQAYTQSRLQGELIRGQEDRQDTLSVTSLWLGGRDYLRSIAARSRWVPDVETHWQLDASLALQQYPTQSAYNSAQSEVKLGYGWRPAPGLRLNAWAGMQLDSPFNSRPGGSRQGPVLQLEGQHILAPAWHLGGGLRFQQLADSKAYSPLFGETKRKQSLAYGWFSLVRHLTPKTRCSVSGQTLNSADRIALFNYAQAQLWLGCEQDY